MAKIPFDIKYRPQIESGEYKLETECGHPVSIMDWEWIDRNEKKCLAVKVLMDEGFNIGYLFGYDGKRHSIFPSDSDSDLFIITPKPELSEFEEKVKQLIGHYPVATIENKGSLLYEVRKAAAELLELARKEALKDLPRWRKCDKNTIYNTKFNLVENGAGRFLMVEGYQIDIDSLEKLPGFKED